MHGLATGKGDGGCPQGVVRGGNQHLVTGVQHGLHGHDDKLTDTVTQENIVDVDFIDAPLLTVVHHCLASGEKPF